MLSLKKDLQWAKSLQMKKHRMALALFVVEGKKMVEEACRSAFAVEAIFTTDEAFAVTYAAYFISPKEMNKISGLTQPPGYLAILQKPSLQPWSVQENAVLVLDGISDPGNMGTILRTADWFGISDIFCSEDSVELYSPKVVQATMGSIFRVNVWDENFMENLSALRKSGYILLGADLSGDSVYAEKMSSRSGLVIGSESHGIRPAVRELLSKKIHIPGAGGAESLNASVAAAILMSEYFRKTH